MMSNLIKADLFKETKKRGFKVILFMIVFVSFISVLILNKVYKVKEDEFIRYDLYTKEEYKTINKYGNYEKYKKSYKSYEQIVNNGDKINVNKSKVINILEYKNNFLYFIGVIVVFFSFNSLSYDYNKGTLKYIVLNKNGRNKLLLSKILSQIILSLMLIGLFSISYLLFNILKFNVNLLNYYKYIYIFTKFIKLPYLLYYFLSSFVFIFPYVFIIVTTYLLTIVFKGSTISLVINNLIYLFSLVISQFLFASGFSLVKFTFMPYLDFTYLNNFVDRSVNNLIFNTNICYETSILFLIIYSFIFLLIELLIFKNRDIQ